ncbi:MAG: 7TM domain-containing protein [Candidatus Peribacteraceae bacterium]|nr:7TM domain-containing protein [Candidatus Peribacteraceae bacterium]
MTFPRVRTAFVFLSLGLAAAAAHAADDPSAVLLAQERLPLQNQAVIQASEDSPIGRPILLDASLSRIVGADASYTWFVAGVPEPISRTVDAVYTPQTSGPLRFRLIVRSLADGAVRESQAVHTVEVYRRKMVLVAGAEVPSAALETASRSASGAGLYLRVLRSPPAAPSPDTFIRFLSDNGRALRGAESIILWTDAVGGLQSLLQAAQTNPAAFAGLRGQTIVLLTEGRLATVAQTARAPFAVLQPRQIVLLHPEAVSALLLSPDIDSFLATALDRRLDLAVVDASTAPVPPWQPLSLLVNYMLVQGVAPQTIILLLMLPVIATILSFLKQVVGLTTFGLLAPSIVALSFLALGWWAGLLYFLFIVLVSAFSRSLTRRLHILYIPKAAITITVVSVFLLVLLAANVAFGTVLSRDVIFVLLVMATLAESFFATKAEQGWLSAASSILQTIVAALLCVFVVRWPPFQALLLAYPELLLFTVVLNVIVGRYTGLRLSEYIRFRELFRHLASEE